MPSGLELAACHERVHAASSRVTSEPDAPWRRHDAAMTIVDILHGGGMAQVVSVAARLGVADALAAGPKHSGQVAQEVEADADSVHRLLRALASLGLCEEQRDGTFTLTPVGAPLRAGVPGSIRSYAIHWGGSMWPVWGGLFHTVRTGRSPRELVSRSGAFESLAARPEAARVFNDAMTEMSSLVADSVAGCCDLTRAARVADIGGGHGLLLSALLNAWPSARGLLVDQASVLEGARSHLERTGVAHRCELVPGSFLDSIPSGADAYFLKSVLHDWDDTRAAIILANCRSAMNSDGQLFIVERLMPDRVEALPGHRFVVASDLAMMVAASGRERTEASLRQLLEKAGFDLVRVGQAAAHYSVLEARCA